MGGEDIPAVDQPEAGTPDKAFRQTIKLDSVERDSLVNPPARCPHNLIRQPSGNESLPRGKNRALPPTRLERSGLASMGDRISRNPCAGSLRLYLRRSRPLRLLHRHKTYGDRAQD